MEGIRGQLHPLQNPDILEHVFEKLRLNDLKKCRLVCKAWRHSSLEALRPQVQVIINNVEDTESGIKSGQCISEFVELVESEGSTFLEAPFTHFFHIKNGEVDHPHFWRLCGHAIKSLILEELTFKSVRAFRHALFYSCPNLEKLSFQDVTVNHVNPEKSKYDWVKPEFQNRNMISLEISSHDEMNLGLSWTDFFNHFPSLKNLNIRHLDKGCETILKSLATVRKHDSESCDLKKLAFHCNLRDRLEEVKEALVGGELSLEELAIHWIKYDEDVRTVHRIISAHASSLKKVSFHLAGKISDQDIFPFPNNADLPNIQELGLFPMRKLHSMNFLISFPNLKKLQISVSEVPKESPDHLVLATCTELQLDCVENLTVRDIKLLAGCLPNLEKLEIENLDNLTFSAICQYWPNLTSLQMLLVCKVDDAGISGLDDEDVERINQEGESGLWKPITVPRANLASLKYLRKFGWAAFYSSEPLGHCAAIYGVEKLPNLQYLDIHECQAIGKTWDRLRSKYQ